MKIKLWGFAIVFATVIFSVNAHAGTRLKIATLAPDGTAWMKVMKDMAKEVKAKTNGEVKIKYYAGGVMGDEGDVVRKLAFGQVDGGAFTGRGLGEINPAERVLELPLLFNNYKEADCVLKGISSKLEAGFEKKGFVLLGWAEAGFVHVFTNKPIHTADDIKGVKMWMWEGDPLADKLYKANGMSPVPLDFTNVLTSLQTGLIDGVYSTPYAMVATQWYTRVKYMVKTKLIYGTGALLVSKKAFDKLTPEQQVLLRGISKSYTQKLTKLTRKENDDAIAILKNKGIKIVEMDPVKGKAKFTKASLTVYDKLAGELYSRELLNETVSLRNKCRGK